jgi:orotate phosphoribosyltransferase
MEDYKKRLSIMLAETGALFFDKDLILKDGRPTPYFVNLGKLNTGRLFLEIGSCAIASATAAALFHYHGRDLLFDYDRKEAKKHGERSSSAALFVNATFFNGCRVFIVDDVITSMGTKYEIVEKIVKESQSHGFHCEITGLGIAVDREQTTVVYDKKGTVVLDKKGSNPIAEFTLRTGTPFFSVAGIREIVTYLYNNKIPLFISGEKRAIDRTTKEKFDKYMETYGRE